jgi:hypothetical protein
MRRLEARGERLEGNKARGERLEGNRCVSHATFSPLASPL